MGYAEVA
jgi:hypothetical protein